MYIIKQKYIFLSLLFCTLVTDLIHASGFEAPISQAGQAIGSAVIASVAAAVAIASEIIRPIDPEKDLPQPSFIEKPNLTPQQSIPQEIALSQSKSLPAASKAIVKPEDFQTPTWQPAPQKNVSQEPVQISILIQPAPEIPQPEIPASSSISSTQAALMAAQKLQSQKQTVEIQHVNEPVKAIQLNIPVPQKQISQRASQSAQQTPVSCEWNELEEFDEVKEEPIYSFTQLYAQKRSNNHADKLLYERSVHFYFERIQDSSLLKFDPVYQQLTNSRRSAANFSIMDKEKLLLRHESLIRGLHEAHQEIILLQEQDSGSSHANSESQQDKNTPKFDPEDPKDEKKTWKESAEKITATIFDILKKKCPQFFRDGYGLWNKVKIASVSPAMQKVAEFLNIEKDELDIHIRHIFESTIKFTKEGLYRINGFHHDINNIIEKSGNLFRFLDKRIDAQGFYKATIEVIGDNATKFTEKSFFPAHWSPEQVMQEIHYAIRNIELVFKDNSGNFIIIKNIYEKLNNLDSIPATLEFIGQTKDNIPLFMIFNPKLQAFVSIFHIL